MVEQYTLFSFFWFCYRHSPFFSFTLTSWNQSQVCRDTVDKQPMERCEMWLKTILAVLTFLESSQSSFDLKFLLFNLPTFMDIFANFPNICNLFFDFSFLFFYLLLLAFLRFEIIVRVRHNLFSQLLHYRCLLLCWRFLCCWTLAFHH